MRKAPLFLAVSLLVVAGPAASQAQPPAPAEKAAAPAAPAAPSAGAAPAPRLNLKLPNPSQYTSEVPRENAGSAGGLPALGADARPLPTESLMNNPTFPKDTQRMER